MPLQHETNRDGTVTIRGAGWFWARIDRHANVLESAAGMNARPAARAFIESARRKASQHFTAAEPNLEGEP